MVKEVKVELMRIAIGSDRRGFDVKKRLVSFLSDMGNDVVDCGPEDDRWPVDYPIYGERVGNLVSSGDCKYGIVICATGTGIMIAANKVKGIRCGIGYSDDVTRLMREHNDANVIAFGQDHMDYDDIENRVRIFLVTKFLGGYHISRIKQLSDIENGVEIHQTPFLNK